MAHLPRTGEYAHRFLTGGSGEGFLFTIITRATLGRMKKYIDVETLPDWLKPAAKIAHIVTVQEQKQRFEILFEIMLERLSAGGTLRSVFEDDIRVSEEELKDYHKGAFMRWVRKDPERWQQYLEAREIGAEFLHDKPVENAESLTEFSTMEDMRRVEVQSKIYQHHVSMNSRDRFGNKQQIDVNQSINVAAIFDAAQGRLDTLKQIEGHTLSIERDGDDEAGQE